MPRSDLVRQLLDGISAIATTTAAVAIVWFVVSNGSPNAKNGGAPAVEPVTGLRTAATGMIRRHGTPKLAIVEFSDFQCPFCGRYARETFPLVDREFVATGSVEYVFRHFPLEAIHPSALKASEASECAGRQGKRWEMHDKIFANQQALSEASLRGYASELRLDGRTFDECLEGSAVPLIKADQAEGQRLGVQSTPTFFIGTVQSDGSIALVKKIPGALPYATLKAELRKLL